MSFSVPVAAIIAAQNQQRRSRERRKRQEQHYRLKSEKERKNIYLSNDDENLDPAFINCLLYEIENDSVLETFFNTLMMNAQKYREANSSQIIQEGVQIIENIKAQEKKIQAILKEIQDSGIETKVANCVGYSTNQFELTTGKAIPQYFYYYTYFNALELNKKEIEHPSFQDRYDLQKRKCDNLRLKYVALQKELKRKGRAQSIFLFGREKRYEEIETIRHNMKDIEVEFAEEEKSKKQLDTFNAFTPEQLATIKRYIYAVEELKQMEKELVEKHKSFITTIPDIESKVVQDAALDETSRNLGLDEQKITEIFDKITEIQEKRSNGEYNGKVERKARNYHPQKGDIYQLLSGFLDNIYGVNPDKEEIKNQMQER